MKTILPSQVVNLPPMQIGYIHSLRVLACYAVVLLHVSVGIVMSIEPFTRDWWLGHWFYLVCAWCVPVFVMISGALLLDDMRREPASVFYKKRLQRIGIPLLFWTGFYLGCRVVLDDKPVSLALFIKHLLEAEPPYHTYFLYMIVWLYLLTPLLRHLVRNTSSAQRWGLIAIIFILSSSYTFTNIVFWHNKRCLFTFFIPYLGYYLAGHEIRQTDPQKIPSKVLLGLVLISALYILIQTKWYIELKGILHNRGVIGWFSPPVIVISLSVFWASHIMGQRQTTHISRWTRCMIRISPATFGIYLCHVAILMGMGKAFADKAAGDNFFGSVIIGSLLLFLVSWLCVAIVMKIPYLRRLV